MRNGSGQSFLGIRNPFKSSKQPEASVIVPPGASSSSQPTYRSEQQVVNKTARRIAVIPLDQKGTPFIIPAFSTRKVTPQSLKEYDFECWIDQDLISKENVPHPVAVEAKQRVQLRGYLVGSVLLLLGMVAVGLLVLGVDNKGPFQLAGAILGVIVIVAGFIARQISQAVSKTIGSGLELLGQTVSIVWVCLAGIGVPALIMYFDFITLEFPEDNPDSFYYTVMVHGFQFVFIAIASTLPAVFYYLFTRQHLENLLDSFFREVMILDPDILTREEAEAKYAPAVKEVYGSNVTGQLGAGKILPVILATFLIMIGWLLTMLPFGLVAKLDLEKFLNPFSTAVNYGFLGSYFFGLNMVFRRYLRSDLTSKAYSHIIVRILITTILVWIVNVLASSEPNVKMVLLPLTFIIGVVPETGMALIQQALRGVIGGVIPSLKEDYPLSDLQGITLYDQARLLEEGIENIENLAHHNIIQLRLGTRIPMSRIVDLYDQAILYLHLGYDEPSTQRALKRLKLYGIRTATDLELAFSATPKEHEEAFFCLLDDLGDEEKTAAGAAPVKRLKVVMDGLRDDEWMDMLRNWRKFNQAVVTMNDPRDFYREALLECYNCGVFNVPNNKFCRNCGQNLNSSDSEAVPATNGANHQDETLPPVISAPAVLPEEIAKN